MPNVIGDTPYPICVHKLVPNFNFSAFGRSTISKIRNGDDEATRAESWEMRNGKVFSLAGVMGDACIERAGERTGRIPGRTGRGRKSIGRPPSLTVDRQFMEGE